MSKGFDKERMLWLLILCSITESGFKEQIYKDLIQTFIECYGIENLTFFLNADNLGLFKKKGSKFNFEKVKKEFQLINTEGWVDNPTDISYTYNGYAPISCKLVEIFIAEGFERMIDKLWLLPGRQAFPDNEA